MRLTNHIEAVKKVKRVVFPKDSAASVVFLYKDDMRIMKMRTFLSVCVLAALLASAAAENPTNSAPWTFDLDFQGAPVTELIAIIQQKQREQHLPQLNVIIPDELRNTRLPALKLKGVTVPELFKALESASHKTVMYTSGNYFGGGAYGGYRSYQSMTTGYGFKTEGNPKDDSIWYFYVTQPTLPEGSAIASDDSKQIRFYLLTPYLARDVTVDDITTAISTGWKMLGETAQPELRFHKETKLLIAVGNPRALETIEAVLRALEGPKTNAPAAARPKAENPAPKPKADE